MRVLLTGGTSMLGLATARLLSSRGDEVTLFQRHDAGLLPATFEYRQVLGDISEGRQVQAAMQGQDAVLHLAAKVGVSGPRAEFERINVTGTENVLEAAQQSGVSRLVYVSSPSVAHAGDSLVGSGAEPADPSSTRGHYSTTKAIAEQKALWASSAEMAVVAIRPHLVWGPGDLQLVGRIVERARAKRLVIIGSGAALIDSTYVDNAAAALVSALDRSVILSGQVFVVSNGQPRTVVELISRILRAAGLNEPTRHVPRRLAFGGGLAMERFWEKGHRENDPPLTSFMAEQLSTAHWFDQRRTQHELQWMPHIPLEEGFERLSQWFQTQSIEPW